MQGYLGRETQKQRFGGVVKPSLAKPLSLASAAPVHEVVISVVHAAPRHDSLPPVAVAAHALLSDCIYLQKIPPGAVSPFVTKLSYSCMKMPRLNQSALSDDHTHTHH
jgi:hypothetical protein